MSEVWKGFLRKLNEAHEKNHELDYDPQWVRALPEEWLAEGLAEMGRRVARGDTMAFEPAAQLGIQEVIPALERFRAQGTPSQREFAARALFRLRGDPMPTSVSIDLLTRGLDAYTLRTSDRPEAIPALLALLTDSGLHARIHAAEGLVEKLGLTEVAAPWGSPLRRLLLAVSSHLPTAWPDAALELQRVLSAVHSGAKPEELDLVYVPSSDPQTMARFAAEASNRKPFDATNLLALGPHDRSYAATVLIARLRSGDVHAPPALRVLGVVGWERHVRAALPFMERNPDIARAFRAELGETDPPF